MTSGVNKVDISRLKKLHLINRIQRNKCYYSDSWWMFMIENGIINVVNGRPVLTNKGKKLVEEYEIEATKRKELSKRKEKIKRKLIQLIITNQYSIVDLAIEEEIFDITYRVKISTSLGIHHLSVVMYHNYSDNTDAVYIFFVDLDRYVKSSKTCKRLMQSLKQKIIKEKTLFYVKHNAELDKLFSIVE